LQGEARRTFLRQTLEMAAAMDNDNHRADIVSEQRGCRKTAGCC